MTLTKEIIEREMRIWERNGYIEGTVWARHYIDLCRLALLGLERDTRAERIGGQSCAIIPDQGVELPGLRDGYASEGGIIAVIAAAMEDEA